jgi:hypothetical protein
MEEFSTENQHYVLFSDEGEFGGLYFSSEKTGRVLRGESEWTDPTWEQTLEWDGYGVITIEEEFVDIYDEMLANGEEITMETIQPYMTEQAS